MKKSDLFRNQENPEVCGYKLDKKTLMPVKQYVDTNAPGDYGADPIGDGTFKMIPSGDIVNFDERNKRLNERR